jgi:P4 family phage/plasmid primase-like protien
MASYKDLSDFLLKHNGKNDSKTTPTHTRIPDKTLQIYGGAYQIPADELPAFFVYYYDKVFVKNHLEYLTEKQLETGGPILVDFDFRYDYEVDTRQHTKEHIQDMVLLYLEELKGFFTFVENMEFPIYVMEKPKVNRLDDKSLTKDGIHMIIGVQMDNTMQLMLRKRVVDKLAEMWDGLPITNNWASVLDEGISKGKTNWQMYGSRKPGNDAYQMTQYFEIKYDSSDGEFMIEEKRVIDFDMSKNLFKLSAQYPNHPAFEMNPSIVEEYTQLLNGDKGKARSKTASKAKLRLLCDDADTDDMMNGDIPLSSITNKDILVRAINKMLSMLTPAEYFVKETHEYAQVLPEKYYEPGSHLLNRQVAFALKHTDERLFLSWVLLRSKASDFDYNSIPELYSIWNKHIDNNKGGGVTRRSIMYWAKQDAFDDFQRVKDNTVDSYIEETIASPTDYDFAMVLYNMFKDRFVCASLISKPVWYTFINHRWEPDHGETLRLCISRDMHSVYQKKVDQYTDDLKRSGDTQDPERAESLKKQMKYICELQIRLRKTNDKNNIMKEASAIFYDKFFTRNMDANKYLLCFTNGVVDFKNKCFRDGYPQDYITKTTGIPYVPMDESADVEHVNGIQTFMKQLFPVEELCRYMWDHLASCLIGTNLNQTFNIYRGNGSNGKSKLVEFMNHGLGEYAGTVPITLVSDKRPGVGGTSSEVIQLKGLRYAVMQEPSKDTRINEGVMKELTGGDKIQARALYSASETFTPQFKLCVCTNTLFEINSNDDGTWRRIRICDFMSKFVDTLDENEPYHFLKDVELDNKIIAWAPLFMSMLVKRAFETNGHVEDCEIVKGSSNRYRQGQDHIAAFVSEMIVKTDFVGDKVCKKELANEFKMWFQESQGMRKMPKGTELYEYMEKKFGKWKPIGWTGIKIAYPEKVDELIEVMD